MLKLRLNSALGAGLVAAAFLAAPRWAAAADCPSDLPNPIYGTGGSAFTPAIAQLAAKLYGTITVFYADPSGCNAADAFVDDDYRITGTVHYWPNGNATAVDCTLPVEGVVADFGNQNSTAESCGYDGLPAGVGDFVGAAQSVNFVVNAASDQTSISREAAYFVFGFGGSAGQVAPWDVDANVFVRSRAAAVQLVMASALGIPADAFKGTSLQKNSETVSKVGTATDFNSAIGFVSAQNADLNRATLKTLAYQHTGQSCGYWPDSTPDAFDKINVRNGQYYLWTYNHFFARVDEDGEIENPNVRAFVNYFTDPDTAPEGLDPFEILVSSYNVPQCAMRVKRDEDVGPLSSYAPPNPCGCAFEKLATGETSCTPCAREGEKDECSEVGPSSTCRRGYCEAY